MSIEDKILSNDIIQTTCINPTEDTLFSIKEIWEILCVNKIWLIDGTAPFEELTKTIRLNMLNKKQFQELFKEERE